MEDVLERAGGVKQFAQALRKKNFLHNYLFLGTDQVGKERTAKLVAKGILCENDRDVPCNHCTSCELFERGNHPDFIEIHPTKTTSAASIKKAAVEEILEESGKKSYMGGGKVYLIYEIEKMTESGQNTLLKTFEEPMEGVHFLLLGQNEEFILPTVLSRANIVTLSGMDRRSLKNTLIQEGYSPEMAERLIPIYSSYYQRGEETLTVSEFMDLREGLLRRIDKVIFAGGYEIFRSYSFFEENRAHLALLFSFLESWARDLAVLYVSGREEYLENFDKVEEIKRQESVLKENSTTLMEDILRAQEYILYHVNLQLVIENMLLNIGGKNDKSSWGAV